MQLFAGGYQDLFLGPPDGKTKFTHGIAVIRSSSAGLSLPNAVRRLHESLKMKTIDVVEQGTKCGGFPVIDQRGKLSHSRNGAAATMLPAAL